MQISWVREGIANAARNIVLPNGIAKLTATAYVPDAIVAPCFFIAEVEINYDKAMARKLDELLFTCRVLVGRQDDQASQRILDAMLSGSGPASLKQAIEEARGLPGEMALDGAADDLHIQRVQGYRWYEHNSVTYVGAELIIKVIGPGDHG